MKNIRILFIIFILFSTTTFASSVNIFIDSTTYTPDLKSQFIGFNKKIEIYCNWSEVEKEQRVEVKEDCYLCNLYNSINQLENRLTELRNKEKVIMDLLANLKTNENTFFKMSEQISQQLTKIEEEKSKLQNLVDLKRKKFQKLTKSEKPIFISQKCKNPIISINRKDIDVNLINSLKILSVNKNKAILEVAKILKLSNKSGIDIKADEANIIFQYAQKEIRTFEFHPKVIYPETLEYFLSYGEERYVKAAVLTDRMIAESKGNRNYRIQNLYLPANGLEKKFSVKNAKINADFSLIVYPFRDKNVYRQLIFKLPFNIDTKYWDVKYKNEHFSKVYSKFNYDTNSYILFAGIDYDILVKRENLIKKRKPTGFLRNKLKIKLGYKINVSNLGKETKEIKVIDRVPISGDKRIEIADVNIDNKNCKLEEKGKVSCNIQLKPQESSEIVTKYAIVFDKKLFNKEWYEELMNKY